MREIIGNTTATPNPRPDWAQNDETKADFIKNKPEIPSVEGFAKTKDVNDAQDELSRTLIAYTDKQVKTKTSVTVGGIHQEVFNADDKLDKVTDRPNTIYGISNQSTQTMYSLSSDVVGSSIPFRDSAGRISASAPSNQNHVANKLYVDDRHQKAIEVANGKTKTFTVADLTALGTLFGIDTSIALNEYIITTAEIIYRESVCTLKQGDIFLIVDTDVPDYWVSIDDMKLYKMETSKIDLSEYATMDDINQALGDIETALDSIITIQNTLIGGGA